MTNIARDHLIRIFHSRFFNKEFYSENKHGLMLLEYETNRPPKENIFDDVLNLCMHTDICKTLNISFFELMEKCDLPTYTRIKKAIIKENERKAQLLEKTQQQTDKRQQQLLGKNHDRK